MEKYILGLLMSLLITTGYVGSTPLAPLDGGVDAVECFDTDCFAALAPDSYRETETMKVPVYSVPLPEENKIVLVKDPKGFVERALKHKMEYLAIKPSDKGEFWELMPVFADEASSLSFNLNKSDESENADSGDEEPLRIVAVKDFIRYN